MLEVVKKRLLELWDRYGEHTSWLLPALCIAWYIMFGWSWKTNAILYTGAMSTYGLTHHYLVTSLLTTLFVHDGLAHLFGNMMYLLIILAMLYYLDVNDKLIWITFLASGLVGNLIMAVILVVTHTNMMVVGASGPIYGLCGLILMETILKRKSQHVGFWFYVWYALVLFTLGYGITTVSAGTAILHVTGLATGLVLGMWFFRKRSGFGGDKDA